MPQMIIPNDYEISLKNSINSFVLIKSAILQNENNENESEQFTLFFY